MQKTSGAASTPVLLCTVINSVLVGTYGANSHFKDGWVPARSACDAQSTPKIRKIKKHTIPQKTSELVPFEAIWTVRKSWTQSSSN